MKKNMKRLLVLTAATLMLAGCSGKGIPSSTGETSEDSIHYVDGTLHHINIGTTDIPFVTNGLTSYKILVPADDQYAYEGAARIASCIKEISGAAVGIEEYDGSQDYTADSHYIVFGADELSAVAGVAKTTENLDITGYQITTKDKSIFVFVNHKYGYQQACDAFMRYAFGYERVAPDLSYYDSDCSTLPDLDIVERPDFQLRTQSNKSASDVSYDQGFRNSVNVFYTSSNVKSFHNSFDWVNPDRYRSAHPGWYSDKGNQLCMTAHGDAEEYEAMVELVFSEMKTALVLDQEKTTITFTMEDNTDWCGCDSCKANLLKYGADSAGVVLFMNDLNERVQNYLQEQADANHTTKREVDLLFFAYHRLEAAPVTRNTDGTLSPTYEEVKCDEHVCPYIALIKANYTHSFYEDQNYDARSSIEGWSTLANRIYLWLYETNFSHYLYPLNTYSTMPETYRYCASQGAFYMYNEGQHNQGAVTCFGRFKEYFNMIAEINVNTPYEEIVDNFFSRYFLEAKEPMMKLFNEIQDQCYYLENNYPSELTGNIYDDISQSRFWPRKLLDHYLDLVDEAYDAIAGYESSNHSLYQVLRNHINIESIFPRYAILENYYGQYSDTELSSLRRNFLSDCSALGVTNYSEGSSLDSLKSAWGL